MQRDDAVTIAAGAGYWDITSYPYGGCFRRASVDVAGHVERIYSRFNTGTPREVVVRLADGHRACVQARFVAVTIGAHD